MLCYFDRFADALEYGGSKILPDPLVGNRHFFDSDYMVHRRQNYMVRALQRCILNLIEPAPPLKTLALLLDCASVQTSALGCCCCCRSILHVAVDT